MDSLSKIDTARLDYHSNKDSPNKMELFYRRRLLSTLDDILITLFTIMSIEVGLNLTH